MSSAGSPGNAGAALQENDDKSRNLAPAQDPDKIVVSKFWKSRSRSEHIQVSLFKWQSLPLIDVRVYVDDEAGRSMPSKKGICISVHKADELIKALRSATVKADSLGWLSER
jgi:hypothetical protein